MGQPLTRSHTYKGMSFKLVFPNQDLPLTRDMMPAVQPLYHSNWVLSFLSSIGISIPNTVAMVKVPAVFRAKCVLRAAAGW